MALWKRAYAVRSHTDVNDKRCPHACMTTISWQWTNHFPSSHRRTQWARVVVCACFDCWTIGWDHRSVAHITFFYPPTLSLMLPSALKLHIIQLAKAINSSQPVWSSSLSLLLLDPNYNYYYLSKSHHFMIAVFIVLARFAASSNTPMHSVI